MTVAKKSLEPQTPQAFSNIPPAEDQIPTQETPERIPMPQRPSPATEPVQTLAQALQDNQPTILTILVYPANSSTPPQFSASKPISYSVAVEALLKTVKDLMVRCEQEAAQAKSEVAALEATR